MAISRAVKEKALNLYVSGMSREAIAREIGVPSSTVKDWFDRDIPENWDAARKTSEEKARARLRTELEEERVRLGTVHFKDLELLRGTWRRHFLQPTMTTDPATGQERQATDANGKPMFHARNDFTAGQIRFLAATYRDIQVGQSTIFGKEAYIVGLATKGGSSGADLDPAVTELLDRALAELGNADQSDVPDEEDDG